MNLTRRTSTFGCDRRKKQPHNVVLQASEHLSGPAVQVLIEDLGRAVQDVLPRYNAAVAQIQADYSCGQVREPSGPVKLAHRQARQLRRETQAQLRVLAPALNLARTLTQQAPGTPKANYWGARLAEHLLSHALRTPHDLLFQLNVPATRKQRFTASNLTGPQALLARAILCRHPALFRDVVLLLEPAQA